MWTQSDIEYLEKKYSDRSITIATIALELGKSSSSVRAEASRRKLTRSLNKSNDQFEEELRSLDIGIVNLDKYISANTKIRFKCSEGHEFTIVPRSILERKKCPMCSYSGFKAGLPAYLYLIQYEIDGLVFYKLGVTNRTPEIRAKADLYKYNSSICWAALFELGSDALLVEKRLKIEHKKYQINTGLLESGNTETFMYFIEKPDWG